jgi:hypothetical protein
MKAVVERVMEAEKRPRVLTDLDKHLNTSRMFLELAKNATVTGMYSDTETSILEKLVEETEVYFFIDFFLNL